MRPNSDKVYLQQLIAEGEHQQQDFKFEISDARKIARSLSAFSNTDGGRLLIGVKDNGRIAGVRSEEEIYMIEAAAKLYCRPNVEIGVQTYEVDGKTVLVAEIPKAEQKPVQVQDETGKYLAYVRDCRREYIGNTCAFGCVATEKQRSGNSCEIYRTRTIVT